MLQIGWTYLENALNWQIGCTYQALKLERIFQGENTPEHTINSVIRYRQSALRHHRLAKEKRKLHSNNCKQIIKKHSTKAIIPCPTDFCVITNFELF